MTINNDELRQLGGDVIPASRQHVRGRSKDTWGNLPTAFEVDATALDPRRLKLVRCEYMVDALVTRHEEEEDHREFTMTP